jgi:hypothetical protein
MAVLPALFVLLVLLVVAAKSYAGNGQKIKLEQSTFS